VVDRAVALENLLLGEPGLLELTVHVRGEDEAAPRELCAPAPQEREARVGHGAAVQPEPVPVEAPAELRSTRNQRGLARSSKASPSRA